VRDIYVPDGSAMIGAFQAGQRQRQYRDEMEEERRAREARRGVGAMMASGDYEGAAAAAFDAGDLSTGLQLRGASEKSKADARRREIRKTFASDPDAAVNAALEEDEDLYKDLRELQDAAQKQRYAQFAAVLRTIGQQEPEQWDDLVAANRGQLEAAGVAGAEIDAFLQASPQQRVGMMALMLQRADQFDKFQTERHQDREFKATQEDRAQDNRRADQQLAISRGNLAVSQGNLSQRRTEHAERKAQGGYAPGPGAQGAGRWEEF
jgi:hypothetical protein